MLEFAVTNKGVTAIKGLEVGPGQLQDVILPTTLEKLEIKSSEWSAIYNCLKTLPDEFCIDRLCVTCPTIGDIDQLNIHVNDLQLNMTSMRNVDSLVNCVNPSRLTYKVSSPDTSEGSFSLNMPRIIYFSPDVFDNFAKSAVQHCPTIETMAINARDSQEACNFIRMSQISKIIVRNEYTYSDRVQFLLNNIPLSVTSLVLVKEKREPYQIPEHVNNCIIHFKTLQALESWSENALTISTELEIDKRVTKDGAHHIQRWRNLKRLKTWISSEQLQFIPPNVETLEIGTPNKKLFEARELKVWVSEIRRISPVVFRLIEQDEVLKKGLEMNRIVIHD